MIREIVLSGIFTIVGYLMGSILFSELSMRVLRKQGLMEVSGNHNPGVSNAYKYGGFWTGTLALVGDLLKGILPVFLYLQFTKQPGLGLIPVMIAPVLGHAFSVFWKGKGGMSITASFGVSIGLFPNWLSLGILIALFLLLLLIPGMNNSLRSLIAYVLLAVIHLALAICGMSTWYISFGILGISGIVCYKMWPDYKGRRTDA